MSTTSKLGLTQQELVEVDGNLRKLAEVKEFAEKLHQTGLMDMTDELVQIQQTIDALTRLKAEFAPHGAQPL